MPGSEIARLLQQFREEEEAAQRGLNGYAIVSRHAFITKHVENMGHCFHALTAITGSEEAAMGLIIEDQRAQETETTNRLP